MTFNSLKDLRIMIDTNIAEIINNKAILVLPNNDLSDMDKMFIDRYKNCNLIAKIFIKQDLIYENNSALNNEDFIKIMQMFNFEKNYIFKQLQSAKKNPTDSKTNYYVEEKTFVKYKHIKNNSDKLIIVFQSSWANFNNIHSNRGNIHDDFYEDDTSHKKYQFFPYSRKKEYDFIFLEDDFQFIYGWFSVNNNEFIVDLLRNFIRKISASYKEKHIVGASKGGYGAYHIGKTLDFIDSISLIAPIVNIENYPAEAHKDLFYYEIFNSDLQLISKTKLNEQKPATCKNILAYTGKHDYQYEEILKIKENFEIIFDHESTSHNDIIVNNYASMFENRFNLKL